MAGERAEGESPSTSSQTDQAGSPAQASGRRGREALARVQEAVINVKEGGLPGGLGGCYRGDRFCSRRSARQARGRSAQRRCGRLGGCLEEVEKGKVANLLPVSSRLNR